MVTRRIKFESKAEIIGIQVIKDYIKAFNERNSLKMADLFNFPHVRFANDSVSVITKSEYLENQDKVTKLLMNENGTTQKLRIFNISKVIILKLIL